jgi:AGCS family alanine or glycine:cation symporter
MDQSALLDFVTSIRDFVWGLPLIILLVGTGIYLTIALRGIQFRKLWHALYLGLVKRKEDSDEPGDISHFQALMTALAATVGTGNIAGVGTAIATGGPGALFWMWVTGLFGMATKYAEAVLAVKYREKDELGTMSGGPMYYISKGLGWKWLGVLFAFFAAIAAFGIGNMVQSNSVADALESTFGIPFWASGLVLALAAGLVILGGIKSIGRATGILVPFMVILYMIGGLAILILNIDKIPAVFSLVIEHAFTTTAASGGFLGATVKLAVQTGVARGVFSNESGLGSAPIAAAAAQTKHPVTQALVSMTQTFIDTLVVCSVTGFVIISTGIWDSGQTGAELTTLAFAEGLGSGLGNGLVAIGLVLFAFSTVLGWSYYGEKSVEYLGGVRLIVPYRVLFIIFVFVGAVSELELVWRFSDVMNGLMAFPNLIGLLGLSGVIVAETRNYFS